MEERTDAGTIVQSESETRVTGAAERTRRVSTRIATAAVSKAAFVDI